MSGDGEQSYYEIALTNRQVVVAFVGLLASLVVVFFAGVLVGRVGSAPAAGVPVAVVEATPTPPLSPATPLPDLGKVAAAADPTTTLAEDVGRRVPPAATPTPRATPAATATPAPAPAATATPVARPSATPVATPVPRATPQASPLAPSADPQVVQVFSSPDEAQARRVLAELQGGGFEAFLSPVEVGGGTMFRVRLGPYDDRAAAEEAARRVRARLRLETWITSAAN